MAMAITMRGLVLILTQHPVGGNPEAVVLGRGQSWTWSRLVLKTWRRAERATILGMKVA